MKKNLFLLFAALTAVVLSSCSNQPTLDPRDAFVGEYSFVSDGSVNMYAGAIPASTIPLGNEGDMTFVKGDESGQMWVISEGDSTLAHVSDNYILIEPDSDEFTYGDLLIHLAFTYGKTALENNVLNIPAEVDVTATYKGLELKGNGHLDIVATKK